MLLLVKFGSDSGSKDVKAVWNQDHAKPNEGKQPGGPLQTKSVVHLRDEQREGSTPPRTQEDFSRQSRCSILLVRVNDVVVH